MIGGPLCSLDSVDTVLYFSNRDQFANVYIGQMTCFENNGFCAECNGWNSLHSVKPGCYEG